MTYKDYYINGITKLVFESDGENLTGLWFDGSHDNSKHSDAATKKNLPIFAQTKKWLDIYFSGKNPDFVPQLKINNLTSFRKEVYEIMRHIPYGKTMTYGEIAEILAKKKGIKKMSAQAVGGAVGANQICIILPCHRVVGKTNLVGFGGGIGNKKMLLEIEKQNVVEDI